MPFPTSTILFLLWFFLACFVLSPYKLLLRVSVNSFQVLVSHHPAVPVRLPALPATAAPAQLSPGRLCSTSPWGNTPGALKNSRLFPTLKKIRPTYCFGLQHSALLRLLSHEEVRVQREHPSHPLQERTPAPVRQALAISWKALLAMGVTKPVGFCLQPESSVDRFPSAQVKLRAEGSLADPQGDF